VADFQKTQWNLDAEDTSQPVLYRRRRHMLIINENVLPCDGILLDFDGTLVDSEPTLLSLWVDICKERDKLLDSNLIETVVRGRPATKIVTDLFPNLDEAEKHALLQALELKEEVAPYNIMDGAYEFIYSAKAKGIVLGIVTTSWRAKVWNVLNRFNIGHLFSVIVTREDVAKLKPDPEPYLTAVRLIGIDPSRLVAFEDSSTGVTSVKAAGIRCIGFGHESSQESGADFAIPAFRGAKFAVDV
jgi:sugar-phosphatase